MQKETKPNRNIYSVGQVNAYVKRLVDGDFLLGNILVRGEISNLKYHYSGHVYFSLKDVSGVISCVMFASNVQKMTFRMKDGMQVIVHGNVSVYERDGRYQLYAREIEEEGQGNLYLKYEELKKKLSEMGMFAEEYKKPIPPFAMRIGVVTAETGAVIRDIYNVASRRNPYCQIYLYPAQVQGEGAADTICRGIAALDEMGLDVIIVGRGGGSIEDLWCFNEESVARAIFRCDTPVISAVGHETDFTIADFVADLRAPTPSAAAELAVFDYGRFMDDLAQRRRKLEQKMQNLTSSMRDKAEYYRLRLENRSPKNLLLQKMQYLQDLSVRLDTGMEEALRSRKDHLALAIERLEGLSPVKRLSQGYSYTERPDGKAVKSIRDVETGDRVRIHVTDGVVDAEVLQAAGSQK